jgi:hypothetical protein
VISGGHLTLDNVDIKNGCADAGGGVLVLDGQLTTKDLSFLNNTARIPQVSTTSSGGGALVFFDASAIGQIETTVFKDNLAVSQANVTTEGGAIKVQLADSISITNSDFITNHAIGDDIYNASGGALMFHSATVSISGSTFISNDVSGSRSQGGAIFLDSTATLNELSTSEFLNNQTLANFSESKGGALYLTSDNAILSDLVFKHNTAVGEGINLIGSGQSAKGGAINFQGLNNSITNSYFFENQSIAGDGTRGGQASGGAIYASNGIALINVTFANNSTHSGNGTTEDGGFAYGGALYSCELPLSTGVTFSGNQAIGGDSISATGGSSLGGGAYVDCAPFDLQNSTFINNKSTAGLGTVSNGTAQGGGIHLGDSLNIGSSILENNKAEVGGVITNSDCYIGTGNPASLISQGYNLIGDAGNCDFSAVGDQVGVSASLLPIADNGCETSLPDGTCLPTHGIDINSNALDQGSCVLSGATTDARGFVRPFDLPNTINADDACDVGAYESHRYQVAVDVSGLADNVTLSLLNNSESLDVTNNDPINFLTEVIDGGAYAVSVLTNPSSPNQECLITSNNASGSIDGMDVVVEIECTTLKYNVGVDVTGLASGNTVEFDNNGENLIVPVDGEFDFATAIDDGTQYIVTVIAQPQMPNQMCSVIAGMGTLDGADVLLTVTCTTNQYFVGGMASGLANGNSVTLSLGAEDLDVNDNDTFVFLNPLTDESNYSVSVTSQPTVPNQTCEMVNPTGTIAGDDIDDMEVNCITNQYMIGGTVTGLHSGNNLVIQNNNGDDLFISIDGDFDFVTSIDDLQNYSVSILNQPTNPIQTCIVSNNSGNVSGNNVTSVLIVCGFGSDLIFENGFEL